MIKYFQIKIDIFVNLENTLLYPTVQDEVQSLKDRIEELADMLEIINFLAKLENATLDEVIAIANVKSLKRGAFNDKIFLEKVLRK